MYLIRSLTAELAYARKPFPMGEKGLTLTTDGKITPEGEEMARLMAILGPSVKPGDRVRVTNIDIKGNSIRFDINGGPKKKKKWYERIQVGMGGSSNVSVNPDNPDAVNGLNARGTFVTLVFPNYVPDITADQVKELLKPVLDFSSLSATEAYLDTIPPKAKQAIKDHQVLVGMDRNMVSIALGRPPKKYRDKDDQGRDYEEWIYGEPPQDVQFVRFVGDEVVRVEFMKLGGEKVVRTQKEIELQQPEALAKKKDEQPGDSKAMKRPSLRRPGEEVDSTMGPPVQPPSPQVDPDKRDPTVGPRPTPPVQTQPQGQPQVVPPPALTGDSSAPQPLSGAAAGDSATLLR